MLASLLAPYITGRYDVTVIPISLPTPLVTILLPSIWSDGQSIFLNQPELEQAGLGQVPSAGEGKNWAIVQVGKQISTGVGFGPGRKTFYEAKLEIPFLRHPHARSSAPFTYKHTLLFSSHMMALSSQNISGLNSSKVNFQVDDFAYQAEGVLSCKGGGEETREASLKASEWNEEVIKKCFESWFVGEQTGEGATKFHTEDISPPKHKSSLHVRLHLPTLTTLPLEAIMKLLGKNLTELEKMDGEGWYDVKGIEGWEMSVKTKMEVKKVAEV